MTLDTHEVLKNARAILAERGLTKHTLQDDDGRVCLRGAILLASHGEIPRHIMATTEAQLGLVLRCEKAMGFKEVPWETFTDAARWNNQPETTQEMVLERFDEGIEATAPQEAEPVDTLVADDTLVAA